MFVKWVGKDSLDHNFEQAKDVENEFFSYDSHASFEEIKLVGKNPLLMTKPIEREPKYLDNIVKMVVVGKYTLQTSKLGSNLHTDFDYKEMNF